MSAAPVAYELEDLREYAEVSPMGLVPSSEQARYNPRFRVVKQRPRVSRRTVRVSPFGRAMALGFIPAFCLLAYVVGRTAVMCSGYTKDGLRSEIARLKVERVELQAKKNVLQSAGRVLPLAKQRFGMQAAVQRQFVVQVPGTLPKEP